MGTLYKPKDWKAYNEGKRQEGNIFILISPDIEEWWYESKGEQKRGRPVLFSKIAIETCLTFRQFIIKPLRQTQGYLKGLLNKLEIEVLVPDYTTLSKRASLITPIYRNSAPKEDLWMIVDSSGLSVHQGNNWCAEKYDLKRKAWKKLHIALDAESGEVIANSLTEGHVADSSQVSILREQCPDSLEGFYADGSYDRHETYAAIKQSQPGWPVDTIIPPIDTSLFPEDPAISLNQRQKHLEFIYHQGREVWKIKEGYGTRNLVEAFFARYKANFGEGLKSRDSSVQNTEVAINCKLLNIYKQYYTAGYRKTFI
jgi:hypothetical protein